MNIDDSAPVYISRIELNILVLKFYIVDIK